MALTGLIVCIECSLYAKVARILHTYYTYYVWVQTSW